MRSCCEGQLLRMPCRRCAKAFIWYNETAFGSVARKSVTGDGAGNVTAKEGGVKSPFVMFCLVLWGGWSGYGADGRYFGIALDGSVQDAPASTRWRQMQMSRLPSSAR